MLPGQFIRPWKARAFGSSLRCYSTPQPPKASIKLVGELRKLTETSISKARDALVATNNDLDAALRWLQEDLAVSGAKKAEKVGDRRTGEGLIGISVLAPGFGVGQGGIRAAMVELNCETDFVARNDLFSKLLADIAHSTAFHAEEPFDFQQKPVLLRDASVDALLDAPLLESDTSAPTNSSPTPSVGSVIRDTIAKVGEKISFRRATSVVMQGALPGKPGGNDLEAGARLASYVHGSVSKASQGRVGTLALLYLKSLHLSSLYSDSSFRADFEKLERGLARQIVGFETHTIFQSREDSSTALYEQPFMMLPGDLNGLPVKDVLQKWAEQKGMFTKDTADFQGIAVSEFAKWTVGEDLSDSQSQVASAIREQSQ